VPYDGEDIINAI